MDKKDVRMKMTLGEQFLKELGGTKSVIRLENNLEMTQF